MSKLGVDWAGCRTGIKMFNSGGFFDAHEVLEDAWRALPRTSATKKHLQGLVQLSVAFHHQSRGNHVGARSVLERALRNLNGADSSFPDLDLDRLRAELAPWRRYLDESAGAEMKRLVGRDLHLDTAPPLPKILLRR